MLHYSAPHAYLYDSLLDDILQAGCHLLGDDWRRSLCVLKIEINLKCTVDRALAGSRLQRSSPASGKLPVSKKRHALKLGTTYQYQCKSRTQTGLT
jgi:hypothetical protein